MQQKVLTLNQKLMQGFHQNAYVPSSQKRGIEKQMANLENNPPSARGAQHSKSPQNQAQASLTQNSSKIPSKRGNSKESRKSSGHRRGQSEV